MDKFININSKLKYDVNKLYDENEQLKMKNINLINNLETQIDFNKKLINDNIKLKTMIRSKL